MLKIKDSIVLGLTGGFIATLVMDVSNYILYRKKRIELLYGHLAGSILMKGIRTKRKENFVVGQILHSFTGSLLGVPLVYLFKRTGTDHTYIKGSSYGSLAWILLYSVGQRYKLFNSAPRKVRSQKSALFNNLLYGVIASKAIVLLGHPSVFKQVRIPKRTNEERLYRGNTSWVLPNYMDPEVKKPVH